MSVKKLIGLIRKADKAYKLIDENDRIAIGVSGGKDSLYMLYYICLKSFVSLSLLMKKAPYHYQL